MSAQPTMKDVAREAGVALGTVSKVVNGIPVGEEYRLRVEQAIRKLNYRINSYARGMKSSKTMTVAVILPNLVNPYYSVLLNSIQKELRARDYRMLYFSTDYDPAQEQEIVSQAERQKVDGVICLSCNTKLQIPEGLPLVSIDRYFGSGIPCVCSDNYGGGWTAAEKLAELGCKRVALLRLDIAPPHEPHKRCDSFLAACQYLGMDCTQVAADPGTLRQDFAAFLRAHVRDGRPDLDGLFCVNDALAHLALGLLRELGVSVPGDLQLIGFDGIRVFGDQSYICSTFVQPVEAIAETCVRLLLDPHSNETAPLICLPVRYQPGGTTRE